jgi:hypothetical protein
MTRGRQQPLYKPWSPPKPKRGAPPQYYVRMTDLPAPPATPPETTYVQSNFEIAELVKKSESNAGCNGCIVCGEADSKATPELFRCSSPCCQHRFHAGCMLVTPPHSLPHKPKCPTCIQKTRPSDWADHLADDETDALQKATLDDIKQQVKDGLIQDYTIEQVEKIMEDVHVRVLDSYESNTSPADYFAPAIEGFPKDLPCRIKLYSVLQESQATKEQVMFGLFEVHYYYTTGVVYLAYLDTVQHFAPSKLRPFVIQGLLRSIFRVAAAQGFKLVLIDAWPPGKGEDYAFPDKPAGQNVYTRCVLRDVYYIERVLDRLNCAAIYTAADIALWMDLTPLLAKGGPLEFTIEEKGAEARVISEEALAAERARLLKKYHGEASKRVIVAKIDNEKCVAPSPDHSHQVMCRSLETTADVLNLFVSSSFASFGKAETSTRLLLSHSRMHTAAIVPRDSPMALLAIDDYVPDLGLDEASAATEPLLLKEESCRSHAALSQPRALIKRPKAKATKERPGCKMVPARQQLKDLPPNSLGNGVSGASSSD